MSGAKTHKVKDCNLTVFCGVLKSAPLIEQCPVNMECQVLHILDVGSHSLVVGKIVETHVSEDCLTSGRPDVEKIRPITYNPRPDPGYHAVGKKVASAFGPGKEIKQVE